MSLVQEEAQENEDINLEELALMPDEEVVDETSESEEQPELSPIEQKAYDQGWRPQSDFDGPEDHWKTAKEYIRDGEWLAKLKEKDQRLDKIEREFNERLENTNKLHEARRAKEIADLKAKQRDAVDMADTDAYDDAQRQIEELEKEDTPEKAVAQPEKDPEISAWEAKNSWINDVNDERTPVTQAIWSSYLAKNPAATSSDALAYVDKRISELYPQQNRNPRRDQPGAIENNQNKGRQKNKSLTMGDLTQEERKEWDLYGSSMFKTEEAFLKAVTDARKQ